ncbi:hypothetical protein Q0F99_13965 [Rathayibacter oskolensis]|uniref:hypothetical protein n=1 Tax=Rathayibacter oskolensis TaxID=1891671 RepID=UPI00265F93F4|nr:hypothetical protein [Rathayibacter oskolensis]WKK70850.1 hypothetical protein Q0F99_13965 [Rathayibacter oskolensis]
MRDLQQSTLRRTTGLIGSGGVPVPGSETAYRRFLELRREVYVDENGFSPRRERPTGARPTPTTCARSRSRWSRSRRARCGSSPHSA